MVLLIDIVSGIFIFIGCLFVFRCLFFVAGLSRDFRGTFAGTPQLQTHCILQCFNSLSAGVPREFRGSSAGVPREVPREPRQNHNKITKHKQSNTNNYIYI